MLPFGYAAGLVACLADPHARRLGDMVAGTLVVHAGGEREHAPAPVNTVFVPPARLSPIRGRLPITWTAPLTGARPC